MEGRFDAGGGALVPVLPFRTPALRACGISVGGGIVATLAGEPEPYPYHQACRTPPDTPPDTMRFGATWTTLEWDQAPARSLPAQPAADHEPDPGCSVVCEAR